MKRLSIVVDDHMAADLSARAGENKSAYVRQALIDRLLRDSEPVHVPGLDDDLETLTGEAWSA